jgi:hypothetical protein
VEARCSSCPDLGRALALDTGGPWTALCARSPIAQVIADRVCAVHGLVSDTYVCPERLNSVSALAISRVVWSQPRRVDLRCRAAARSRCR